MDLAEMSSVSLGKGSKLSNHPFANTFIINSIPKMWKASFLSVSTLICFLMQFPFEMINVTFYQKTKQKQNQQLWRIVLGQGTALRCKASSLDRNSLRQGMFQFASQGKNPVSDTQSQWKKNLLRLVKAKELRDVKQAVTCFIPTSITCIIVKTSERWEEFLQHKGASFN